jgi:hypothetical protein
LAKLARARAATKTGTRAAIKSDCDSAAKSARKRYSKNRKKCTAPGFIGMAQ